MAAVYVYISRLTWAGFTLLILYVGAMREPEDRDKHGGTYSHVFFVSISLSVVLESLVAVQTSAISHQPFVYDQQRELAGQHLCVPSDETKKTNIT